MSQGRSPCVHQGSESDGPTVPFACGKATDPSGVRYQSSKPMPSTPDTQQARLISVRCENYQAFRAQVEIHLNPLTLVLGRNNSGKSALVRLLRLILRATKESAEGHHIPLNVDGLPFATRFLELIHGRYFSRPLSLGLTLDCGGRPAGFDCEVIAKDSVGEETWIKKLTVHESSRATDVFELDLSAAEQPTYLDGKSHSFSGLLPTGHFQHLRNAAANLERSITHLGPVRAAVPVVMEHDAHASLGFNGAGAPDMLRANRDLAEAVDRWYRENLHGVRIIVAPQGESFSLESTAREDVGREPATINLARAGEGVQQLLPVITQQSRHLLEEGPVFDIVEQPELHLHDGVHPALGDLFIRTAQLGRGPVVVETHSEGLLLRVRRRIAEGVFPPGDLALYFVDHAVDGAIVKRIYVDERGDLSEWPDGVFLDSYREVLAIQRAARDRRPA